MSFMKSTGKAIADVIPGLGKFTFDNAPGKIFITSGTGVIGYRVAMSLLEAGHKDVRVGIWFGDRQGQDDSDFANRIADKIKSKGGEVIDFNWADPKCFDAALNGVKSVLCTIPHIENWSEAFPAFLTKAKAKKVEHFVKISFLRTTDTYRGVAEVAKMYRENVPFCAFHGTCDDILEQAKFDSRISYTILGTSHLMPTTLLLQGKTLREEHKFITASYGMGVNYVSPNDVADAAVVVLLNPKPYRNKTFNLTGAGPTKDSSVARLLSKQFGTEIEHVELGYHKYKETVAKHGLPSWQVKDAAAFERMKAYGLDEKKSCYSKDLEEIIGKKPESFEDYLNNKASMRPGLSFP
jgi:uncharacterized protein YbjT (DUF2867 family)